MGIVAAGANRPDMKLVKETLESIPVPRPAATPDLPQGLCMDKGYDSAEVRELVAEFGFTPHVRSRGEEAKVLKREPGVRARRWVVERTHSWMNRFRRVLTRWEKHSTSYLAFLHLSCGLIAIRAAHASG